MLQLGAGQTEEKAAPHLKSEPPIQGQTKMKEDRRSAYDKRDRYWMDRADLLRIGVETSLNNLDTLKNQPPSPERDKHIRAIQRRIATQTKGIKVLEDKFDQQLTHPD